MSGSTRIHHGTIVMSGSTRTHHGTIVMSGSSGSTLNRKLSTGIPVYVLLRHRQLRRQRRPRYLGIATLTRVRHRRELLFAAVPTLFALHQFTEGFVWLGLDGVLGKNTAHNMGAAFMLYAQGLLPFLLPLAVFLFEPTRKARHRMIPFLVLGGLTTLYILWALTAFPLQVYIHSNSIVYRNQATDNGFIAIAYVVATCGSLFFSKVRDMVVFGAANLAILLVVMAVKRYAFTSLWCAYAAVASVIILAYFWRTQHQRPFRYAETL